MKVLVDTGLYLHHGRASLIYTRYLSSTTYTCFLSFSPPIHVTSFYDLLIYESTTGARVVVGPGYYPLYSQEWLHEFNWSHPVIQDSMLTFSVISLQEDNLVATFTHIQSSDEKSIDLTLHIYYKITDVLKVAREVGNPIQSMRTIVLRDIMEFVGQKTYEELLQERTELSALEKYTFLLRFAETSGIVITKVVGVLDSFTKVKKGVKYNVL